MNRESNNTQSNKFLQNISKNRASNILQFTSLLFGVILISFAIVNHGSLPSTIVVVLILGGIGNLALSVAARHGYATFTSIIQFSMTLLLLEYHLIRGDGIHDAAMIGFPVILAAGAYLWGKQAIPPLSLSAIALIGWLITSEKSGRIATPLIFTSGWSDLLTFSAGVLIMGVFLYVTLDRIEKNLQLAKNSEASWRTLVENAPTVIIKTNLQGIIKYINRPPWESKQDFLGQTIYDLWLEPSAEILKLSVDRVILSGQLESVEIKAAPNDDHLVNYSVQIGLTELNDPSAGVTYILTDISSQVRTRNFLEHMVTHDLMTNLPNRLKFFDHLNQEIAQAQRHNTQIAVMLLDLDDFKLINDAYSHEDGDKLLRMLAKRLQGVIRAIDIVARMGSDEFALIIPELSKPEDARQVAHKILETVSEPIIIDTNELFITGSVGIAMYPDDGKLISILIQNAGIAINQAKNQGKNKIEYYHTELTDEVVKQINIAQLVRQGLEQDNFILEYQPQYNAIDNTIIGLEALIRMKKNGSEMIPPNEFIFIAEKSGLILQIGEWVLKTASNLMENLIDENLQPLKIAVNLSEREWQDKYLVDRIYKVINQSGVDPELLELEITENSMFRNIKETLQTMNELKSFGVRLAIDDFGRGSSSLGYLGALPVNTIKIDKDFTHQVLTSVETRAIVTGIIKIAQELNLDIVVEGVETANQVDFFISQGCPIIQGWFFSPSISQEELIKLLRNNEKL